MQIGIIGNREFIRSRRDRLQAVSTRLPNGVSAIQPVEWPDDYVDQDIDASFLMGLFNDLDIAFISVPLIHTFQLAKHAIREGTHVFLDWHSSPSLREFEELAYLAEEAGVEIGVSRPMRFHPLFDRLPPNRAASAISIQHDLTEHSSRLFQQSLEEAVDLCCCYAIHGDARKLDAQLVRSTLSSPDTLLAGVRFHNGVYAHIQIRLGVFSPRYSLFASGVGFHIDVDLIRGAMQSNLRKPIIDSKENAYERPAFELSDTPEVDLIESEIQSFTEGITLDKPILNSILNALQTMRLLEKLRGCLRY